MSVARAVEKAAREAEYYDLAGMTPEEAPHPYDVLERELLEALKVVRRLRSHRHQWNADARCVVCGADGAA